MPKRTLAIGVGGSGKAALTILKERLVETYSRVPDWVVLLALDTDDLREVDTFGGVKLNSSVDETDRRQPEFRAVVSKPGVTMNTLFADLARGNSQAFLNWVEREKLDSILGPAERSIQGGAQQRRPVGRVAVFQRWDNPIVSSIREAITRIYGEPDDEKPDVNDVQREQSQRQIFIVGSVAGGTGSGFILDVANLVRHVISSNSKWQSVDLSAIIVLPDAFSAFSADMVDPTNLKPNSYAALRELDRFMRVHSASLPYMIRYGDDIRAITWNTIKLFDQVYLVDTASPNTTSESDLRGDPMRGVFPLMADFVMAHIDQSLGDTLATLRSNAGLHYDKDEGWMYSGFNVMSYIFPANDVIKSFSLRFLRELVNRQFLPIADKKIAALFEQEAGNEVERVFSQNSVEGKTNPAVVQKAIAVTRAIGPETLDTSRAGLFNLIGLLETAFAYDYQDLQNMLNYLSGQLIPSKEKDYKDETYEDGNARLRKTAEQYVDDVLGKRYDPDNEDARSGGKWSEILGRYREALYLRFAGALDAELLSVMNRRDPQTRVLAPSRLPLAIGVVKALRTKLVELKRMIRAEYIHYNVDVRIDQLNESLRIAIVQMAGTKDKTFAFPGFKSAARKAQESFISLIKEKMELVLHQHIYRIVADVLDALGAAELDSSGTRSVLDLALIELESWQANFSEVDKTYLSVWEIEHNKNREQKRRVKVRRYLTNPEFEAQLYQQPEIFGAVDGRILGQVQGEAGLSWQRKEELEPLKHKMVNTWTEQSEGAEKIALNFLAGAMNLFQVVRDHATAADRIQAEFRSPTTFINTVNSLAYPYLRYSPSENGKNLFSERYLSYSVTKTHDARKFFFDDVHTMLAREGRTIDSSAESTVACTVLELSRGVRLSAIDQVRACELDYRLKIFKGRESLHLFPEEQTAILYEERIDSLGDANNRQRLLAPDLVVAMGDDQLLKAFTLACAFGVIENGVFVDPDTLVESNEVLLKLSPNADRYPRLSHSANLGRADRRFDKVSLLSRSARLHLNALQNLVLIGAQKLQIPPSQIDSLMSGLRDRGVELKHFENPFTISKRDLNEGVRAAAEGLGPTTQEEPDAKQRERENARRRASQLQNFLETKVASFERDPKPAVKDLGTVMHLIILVEIDNLTQKANRLSEEAKPITNSILGLYEQVLSNLEASNHPKEILSGGDVVAKIAKIQEEFCRILDAHVKPPQVTKGVITTEIDLAHFMSDILFERTEARISPRLPLVFCGWQKFGVTEAEILSEALRSSKLNQSLIILFVFYKETIFPLQEKITEKMRSGYGTDVVVIGRDEIRGITVDIDPKTWLRSLILSKIDRVRISPYKITGPVANDLVFSGREVELGTIAGGAGANNYILTGGRRVGKTTILKKLELSRLPAIGYLAIYHDCSYAETHEQLLQALAADKKLKPYVETPSTFTKIMRSWQSDRPLVFLLDEVDKLIKPDVQQTYLLFNIFRALSNEGHCHFILCGEHSLRSETLKSDSPLYNFGNLIRIKLLNKSDVMELVTRPMEQLGIKLEQESDFVESVWKHTFGHPNVVQRLCQRLVELRKPVLYVYDIETITNTPEFQREDFLNTYWETATPLEKIISLLMTENREISTMTAIRKKITERCQIRASVLSVKGALDRLVELRSILTHTPRGDYTFAIEAFPRAVKNTATLQDMLEVLVEEYQEKNE